MLVQQKTEHAPLQFLVGSSDVGKRLDVYLSDNIERMTRSAIQKLISGGTVEINGRVAAKNSRLAVDDIITVNDFSEMDIDAHSRLPQPQKLDLDILYEDEFLVAVNKPAGLVVHPGNGNPDETLVNALLYRVGSLSSGSARERPGIVHRLDKDTSGVIIAAKNDEAHFKLAELFSARKITKTYVAFCIGSKPSSQEVIDLALARSRKNPVRRCVDNRGKKAVTDYQLIKYHRGISLLKLHILTGRTHQIRVHCSHCGFPVVRDELYGADKESVLKVPPMERPFAHSILKCFSRQALHALSLSFIHPFTNETLEIRAPFPEDFYHALRLMQIDPVL